MGFLTRAWNSVQILYATYAPVDTVVAKPVADEMIRQGWRFETSDNGRFVDSIKIVAPQNSIDDKDPNFWQHYKEARASAARRVYGGIAP